MINRNKLSQNYKWVIVALCFLMVMISLGFASSTKSLFPDEIAKDLNTERSLVSVGESMRYIATSVVNIFFGFLVVKFGPKKLILAGFASLVCATLLYSFAHSLPLIYLAGALLGIGFSWTTTTMVGYVVEIWCSENKGTIMGIILASNGIGGAVAIPLVGGLIDPNQTGTYRNAYRLIAAVLFGAMLLILILFRDKPKGATLPVSQGKKKKRGRDWAGIPFSVALHKPYFWGALLCIFMTGMILQGVGGVVAMHMKDVGIDYGTVKGLMSFSSLLLAGAKFLTGFLYDRFGLRLTASLCTVFAVIASFLLALIQNNDLGFILAVTYVVFGQLALPLETIMLPIYAADLFGRASYAKMLGIFVSVNTAGYALGAPILNLCYDMFNSYTPALFLTGFLMLGNLILLQFLISAGHREQKLVAQKAEA